MNRDELARLVDEPLSYLHHEDPAIRRLAVSAVTPHIRDVADRVVPLIADEDPLVRAEAVEALGGAGPAYTPHLDTARLDEDSRVREALATAYGEVADRTSVDWLIDRVRSDDDRMVREAAAASLGAIGDERAIPVLLEALATGPPQVRRRAVVALTVFDGPRVEEAVRHAASDRNPMVREAAQMVVGRNIP